MLIRLPHLLTAATFTALFTLATSPAYAVDNSADHDAFYDGSDSFEDKYEEESEEENDEFDDEFEEDFDEGFYYEDAFSGDAYTDTRPFFSIDAFWGGQTLEKISFRNGETDDIRAGSGVQLSLGMAYLMFQKKVDIGFKAGYLFDLVTAENSLGEDSVLSFTRVPVELFSHYWIGRHILGGGITAHFDPKFTSRETTHNAKYHTAYGMYAEYLYNFIGTGSNLGIRFLNIHYKNKETDEVADGGAWGITFSQMF